MAQRSTCASLIVLPQFGRASQTHIKKLSGSFPFRCQLVLKFAHATLHMNARNDCRRAKKGKLKQKEMEQNSKGKKQSEI